MMEEPRPALQQIEIGGAQIHLLNVKLREDILLDEVHLEGGDIRVEIPAAAGEPPRIFAEGTVFRAMMTEVNLNRALAANPPPGGMLRGLRVAVLSGKLRLTGQIVKGISLPFTIEGVPRIENGTRVSLDWQNVKLGIGMPKAIVDILEEQVNQTLDLTQLPVAVWLDALRCEPGRLTAVGRARLLLPPVTAPPPRLPFRAADLEPIVAEIVPPPSLEEG